MRQEKQSFGLCLFYEKESERLRPSGKDSGFRQIASFCRQPAGRSLFFRFPGRRLCGDAPLGIGREGFLHRLERPADDSGIVRRSPLLTSSFRGYKGDTERWRGGCPSVGFLRPSDDGAGVRLSTFAVMKPMKDVVSAVSEVIERLTLSKREKRQLETDLLKVFMEWEKRVMEARADLLREETRGNWLQRSWRPLVMLAFAMIILVGTFTNLPILSESSRFWDLLEIRLGGYIIGRSGEKFLQLMNRK